MAIHKRLKKWVDNTPSVRIVLPGSKQGRRKMSAKKPYEVEYKGVVIRCATPEEAAKVARLLGGAPENPQFVPWRVDEFTDFVDRIQVKQRRLLAALLRAKGQSLMDYQLRGELELSSNQALAGVLSGVTKVAQLMDIDPKRIYVQHTEYKQGYPERRYWVTSAFQKAAEDADWPSQNDLKDTDALDELS